MRKTRAEIVKRLCYVTNIALAYQQANDEGRTKDAAEYREKIIALTTTNTFTATKRAAATKPRAPKKQV